MLIAREVATACRLGVEVYSLQNGLSFPISGVLLDLIPFCSKLTQSSHLEKIAILYLLILLIVLDFCFMNQKKRK